MLSLLMQGQFAVFFAASNRLGSIPELPRIRPRIGRQVVW